MDSNHNDVTRPVPAYADEALALLAHVEAVEDELGALVGDTERTRNGQIADRHNEIGASLKVADIYATLAVAEAVDRLRDALSAPTNGRPSWGRAGEVYLNGERVL